MKSTFSCKELAILRYLKAYPDSPVRAIKRRFALGMHETLELLHGLEARGQVKRGLFKHYSLTEAREDA